MNRIKLTLLGVIFGALLLTACSNDNALEEEPEAAETIAKLGNQEREQGEKKEENIDFTYELNLENRILTFDWMATNFEPSAENYGVKNVDGQGHAHIWLKKEGEKGVGTRIGVTEYNFTKELDSQEFSSGTYEVEVELAENNHTAIPGTQNKQTIVVK